jgi:hypothetical protein
LGINTHTNRLRLHVQEQLFKASHSHKPNIVEEDPTQLTLSSSFEIRFPASTYQTSRMPTLNVTLTNIERHAKTAKTEPETPYKTSNRTQNPHRNMQLLLQKNFSALNVLVPLPRRRPNTIENH